jgi:ribose transport system substrate-binding protein
MRRSNSQPRRLVVLLLALAALGALVAGCGSSEGSSSSSGGSTGSSGGSGSGSDSAGVAEAKKLTAKYEEVPKSIGITEPVENPIPSGKTIMFMKCGNPSCDAFAEPLEEAAKLLGWNLKTAVAGPTPDKTTEAWNLAVREKPDAVISSGFPRTMWSKQLGELNALGIPVVDCCTTDKPGGGVIFVETSVEAGELGGAQQADWTVAESNGEANALYINIPAFPILTSELEGFEAEFKKLCPECGLETYEQNVADLGQQTGVEKIVGYLRSHPDINYVVAGADDSLVGLPAALAAAGLNGKITAIGLSPSTVNLNYIVNEETEKATISFPTHEIGFKMMDILARYFSKSSLKPDEQNLPRRILTKEGIKNPNVLEPTTPTYEDEFKKLWNLN